MIAIYLSKQETTDFDTKAIQPVNFTGNLDWGIQTAMKNQT